MNSVIDCTEEVWEEVISTNLKSVWLGMKYAIPAMIETGGGAVINIASIAADRGIVNAAAYTASKGGVLSLSREAAIEFAKQNIRVNCINPATIATPITRHMSSEDKERFLASIPQGRFGRPEEVAQLALFLASDEAPFITGHAVVIDGGLEVDSHQVA